MIDDAVRLADDELGLAAWTCEWCGGILRPYDGVLVGDVAGDYCPEGKAVDSTGTSPHLPKNAQTPLGLTEGDAA
jgi:hypothetical protein